MNLAKSPIVEDHDRSRPSPAARQHSGQPLTNWISGYGSRYLPLTGTHWRPGQITLFSPCWTRLRWTRLQSGPEPSRARQQARRSGPLTERTTGGPLGREKTARQFLGPESVGFTEIIAFLYNLFLNITSVMLFTFMACVKRRQIRKIARGPDMGAAGERGQQATRTKHPPRDSGPQGSWLLPIPTDQESRVAGKVAISTWRGTASACPV